jgi:hypothetical protein
LLPLDFEDFIMSEKDDSELQLRDGPTAAGLTEEHAADCRSANTSASGQRPLKPLARSNLAFLADLPELLLHHPEEWVAYADGKRLRFGKTQSELNRYCLEELGLTHDRFIVHLVVPWDPTLQINLD